VEDRTCPGLGASRRVPRNRAPCQMLVGFSCKLKPERRQPKKAPDINDALIGRTRPFPGRRSRVFASIKLQGAPCASTGKARDERLQIRLRSGGLVCAAETLGRAPPPRPRRSRARPMAALQAPRRALCSHRPRHLQVHAARARALRRREPRAAARRRDGQAANGGLVAVMRGCRGVCARVRVSICAWGGPCAQ